MTTKFERLLDLIVNEEMDKANELFHEIVVEKSRNIYENLIADEMDESADEEEMDESADEEEMDESADEEEMDESLEELEDSYSMEADDEEGMLGPDDQTDDLEGDIAADDDLEGSDEEFGGDDLEGGDTQDAKDAIMTAIDELEAALAKIDGGDAGDEFDSDEVGDSDAEFGGDDEFGSDDEGEDDEELQMGMFEGRRITREYTEKVGNDWDKNSMKSQQQYVGAGTGDKEGAPVEGRSPIASGANKPGPAGVNGKNLVQGATESGGNTGTSPAKRNKGINPESGEKYASGIHNVDGKKSGVKTLSKVSGGHGAEKKTATAGPVGSGTGDKAGQTSVAKAGQFLKPYSK